MWNTDAFALTFKVSIFRRALVDLYFIIEHASSVFTHYFILVMCSLRMTDWNCTKSEWTKVELKIVLEVKLNTVNSVSVLILITKKVRKGRVWMLIGCKNSAVVSHTCTM